MFRVFAFVAVVIVTLSMSGGVSAGIDQVFEKPAGKRTWGEIFNWTTGEDGFDKSYALVIGVSEYDLFPRI